MTSTPRKHFHTQEVLIRTLINKDNNNHRPADRYEILPAFWGPDTVLRFYLIIFVFVITFSNDYGFSHIYHYVKQGTSICWLQILKHHLPSFLNKTWPLVKVLILNKKFPWNTRQYRHTFKYLAFIESFWKWFSNKRYTHKFLKTNTNSNKDRVLPKQNINSFLF